MSKSKMENYYTVKVYDNYDDYKKSVNCTEILSFDFKKKTRIVEGLLETTMENGILTIKDGSKCIRDEISAFKIKGDIHSLRYSKMNKKLSVLNTGVWKRFGFKTYIGIHDSNIINTICSSIDYHQCLFDLEYYDYTHMHNVGDLEVDNDLFFDIKTDNNKDCMFNPIWYIIYRSLIKLFKNEIIGNALITATQMKIDIEDDYVSISFKFTKPGGVFNMMRDFYEGEDRNPYRSINRYDY